MTRVINAEGEALIREFEGLRLDAYRDSGGVWTIGYGHTGPDVGEGDSITEEAAERLLQQDIAAAAAGARRLVRIGLGPNEFSALVSFVFNIGEGKLRGTKSVAVLNQGLKFEFANRMLLWNKAGGVPVRGLARRREAERQLFLKDSTA